MTRALIAWALVLTSVPTLARAQSLSFNRGQNVAPAYEGWEEAHDGTKYFLFGYMNRNWEEEIDTAIGPANSFSPGPPDQGQPTHFLPRRNRFVFRVKVPANFTTQDELVWTLTTAGITEKAYASLRTDYKVDDVVKASETGALGAGSSSPEVRANTPPTVRVDGPKRLTAKVGRPVTIVAAVTDDGIPKPRGFGLLAGAAVSSSRSGSSSARPTNESASNASAAAILGTPDAQAQLRAFAMSPPIRPTVAKSVGLHLSWYTYRAPEDAPVTYDPVQIKTWEDTRAGANSPWAPIWIAPAFPADGKVSVRASFPKAGTYLLRALADDGALTGFDEVVVDVSN